VRGFSEALIADLRMNAPHVRVSVVMPGHVGTSIVINSGIVHGKEPDALDEQDLVSVRRQLAADGTPVDEVSDEDLRKGVAMFGEAFRDLAPLSAASAAEMILEGVRQNKWRILVGEDAVIVDQMVRDDPEHVYEPEFWTSLQAKGLFGVSGRDLFASLHWRSEVCVRSPRRSRPLAIVKVREIIRELNEARWYQVRQTGSHRIFRHQEKSGTVTVSGAVGIELSKATWLAL